MAAQRAHPGVHRGQLDQPRAAPHRKLLLHRKEIERLIGKTRESGLSLVPISMYFADGKVKVEIVLAPGKWAYDKRADLAKRDADREVRRALGRRAKGMG